MTSLAELIAYAKANPGKLNAGTAGNGTTSHLAAEMFKKAAGVTFQNVHFRGGAQAMTDLVGGQIQMMIEIMASAIRRSRQRPSRRWPSRRPRRWPLLPDVPTAG